jgi:hypothetical protein
MTLKPKLAVIAVTALCSATALAGTARAGTDARTLCAGVPSSANADGVVCLHAGDAWNWSTAWTQWEWPECHISWYAAWGYSCGGNHIGHYWTGSYNVDWLHYVVNTALTFPGTVFNIRYCANLNINRSPRGGGAWYTGGVYPIWPWQSC